MIAEYLYVLAVIQPFIFSAIIAALSSGKKLPGYLSIASLAVSAISSALVLYYAIIGVIGGPLYLWNFPQIGLSISFLTDSYTAVMMALVSFLSLIIGIYSIYYMHGDEGYGRYFTYFTFFVGSMMLVVSADNLLLLFFGWEGTGLASYALIGHWRHDEKERMIGEEGKYVGNTPMFSYPSMSGLRALLFTRVPDILMLFGIFIVYIFSGTFNISELLSRSSELLAELARAGILTPVMIFLSLGALAKSAQFPLHEWLVTAMTGPTPVSALIHAATMVKAGVYYMVRISPIFIYGARELFSTDPLLGGYVLTQVQAFYYALLIIGALTAFSLASMALVAREAKLILAYSTGSQLGFMFAGIGASMFSSYPSLVLSFVIAHLIAHAVFKAGLFLGAGIYIHVGESRFINDWPNLWKMRTTTSLNWLLTLSLAGLPPFLGFWTKDSLVQSYISTGIFIPTALLIITVLFTAFYSTRYLLYSYRFPGKEEVEVHEPPVYVLSTYGILAVLSIGLGVAWPLFGEKMVEFLSQSFTHSTSVIGTEEISAVLLSTIIVIIGILLSISAYAFRLIDSKKICSSFPILNGFLENRWIINVLYYNIGLAFLKIGEGTYRFFERGLDLLIDYSLPRGIGEISRRFRKPLTGDFYSYLLYFIAGLIIMVILLLIV
ncbi:MAG: proton-conducting transporter membrane subunit [Fervidicoccaceae archaeon]